MMKIVKRLIYFNRIFSAYIFNRKSSNTRFWHLGFDRQSKEIGTLSNYYLDYKSKLSYLGPFDSDGVLMLDYGGNIGKQYNPDSIAQYALGSFELYSSTGSNVYLEKFLAQAEWFTRSITMLDQYVGVWYYRFDFEYFEKLKNPWYTSLGQGHGISVLVRAWMITKDDLYINTAHKAFVSYEREISQYGGIGFIDSDNNLWFEEYVLTEPTHILNGFIWSLWGLHDYWLATNNINAKKLFDRGIQTLVNNIHKYDNGIWSKYDLAPTMLPSIAGAYYHSLHIEQLLVLYNLTGNEIFKEYHDKWSSYQNKMFNKIISALWKISFKLFYY